MTHLEHCLGNSIQFQEQSIFTWHKLCFATARLLPVQAINYCHYKCNTGTHGHILTTSILLLFLSFYFVSPKSNVTCCSEQGTRPGSAARERVEGALWFAWEELQFTWGGRCENTETIPYCFPTCYLQCHKQILKLYVLIFKCIAWNPLRVKCWCYQN